MVVHPLSVAEPRKNRGFFLATICGNDQDEFEVPLMLRRDDTELVAEGARPFRGG
jgi:hypothetical protein